MEMEDKKLKRFLQDEMNREADLIMKEVDSDPSLSDVVAPDEIYDNLMQQIHDYEAEQASKNSQASEEEQELIRLGKLYKKKRSRRKYYVLLLAGVVVLAYGITSIGGGKKVFMEVKDMISGKEQIHIDDTGEKTEDVQQIDEVEAYEEIEKSLGFYPVRIYYLPEGIDFVEATVEEELQSARLYYQNNQAGQIAYYIFSSNRTASMGMDVEDKVINEYKKEVEGTSVKVTEYLIKDSNARRWQVEFVYKDVQYLLRIMEVEADEVEKIIENLYFS